MDPRYPDAAALLDPEGGLPLIHGGMAQRLGQQPAPQLVAPMAQAGPPMISQFAPPQAGPPPMRNAAGPPMNQGAAALPVAPLATAPMRAPAPRGGQPPVPQQFSPEQTHDAMRNMLKSTYDKMGIAIDDTELEEMTQFGLSKHQGMTAKKMSTQKKAGMAKYLSALVAKDQSELAARKLMKRLKSDVAEAKVAGDEGKRLHYQGQLDAARLDADEKGQRVERLADILERTHGIDRKYLADPISVFAFSNDDPDYDYSDFTGDDETP